MKIKVLKGKYCQKMLFTQIVGLRKEVFVEEQGLAGFSPTDSYDSNSLQIAAIENKQVIGHCRLRLESEAVGRLERVCVKKQFRKQGIGGKLLLSAEQASKKLKISSLVLMAQLSAVAFYQYHGYFIDSKVENYYGKPHVQMRKKMKEVEK